MSVQGKLQAGIDSLNKTPSAAPGDLGPITNAGDPTVEVQDKLVALISQGDAGFTAALNDNIQLIKQSLLGESPTATEEWYTNQLITLWLTQQYLTRAFVNALGGDLGALIQTLGGESTLGTWVKILDIPQARMNQGVRILSNLRDQASKLVGPGGVAQPGAAVELEQQKVDQVMGHADTSIAGQLAQAEPQGVALATQPAPETTPPGQ